MCARRSCRPLFRILAAAALLAGCGGGGGGYGGSSTTLNQPVLSPDQAAFETFALAPAALYDAAMDLPFAGAPVAGTSYLAEHHVSLAQSPLAYGAQKATFSPLASLAATLAIPATALEPGRYLISGQILVGSGPQYTLNYSYQGGAVRTDLLAADGVTPVLSRLARDYSVVSLASGQAAPVDLQEWFSPLTFNPALATGFTQWLPGAAFLEFTSTQAGDSYAVFDGAGSASFTGAAPLPLRTATTIAALMAGGGIHSTADGVTYTMATGTVSMVGGVNTYVASVARPGVTTQSFRTYYDLNGDVYTGELIRDGTVIGGNPFAVAAPGTALGYSLDYTASRQIRLNQAAVQSLKAFVTF